MNKFKKKYPKWKIKYAIDDIFKQMNEYEKFHQSKR